MAARARYPQGRLRQWTLITSSTEMLRLRLMEKKRELVRRTDVDADAGVTLTAFSSLPARCAPRGDLAIRRSIERGRVRGARRDRQRLPGDGRQVRRATAR
jgi:hypothetical protein